MSNDDEFETRVQTFCGAHQGLIKFTIEQNIINHSNPVLGPEGRKHLENGVRDLFPIIDKSQLPALGYEALAKVISGVTLVTFGAAYAEATKDALARKLTKPGRDKKQAKDNARRPGLTPAIVAEATHLGKTVFAISNNFAGEVRPGVRARLGLPREEKGWPEEGTIKSAISRLVKKAKTNRVNPM